MLIGTYYHTLEQHRRVSLPKAFRTTTQEWVITRGLDGGLFLFPKKTFSSEISEIANRTFTTKKNRDYIRLMTNEAQELTPDKNGRIQLPKYLTERAQFSKDIVIVGSYSRVEIWDRDRYHQYLEDLEDNAEKIAESLDSYDN